MGTRLVDARRQSAPLMLRLPAILVGATITHSPACAQPVRAGAMRWPPLTQNAGARRTGLARSPALVLRRCASWHELSPAY